MKAAAGSQPPRVVLRWSPPPKGVTSLSLYRSQQAGQYPDQPVKDSPLRMPNTCSNLEQNLPQSAWNRIDRLLSESDCPLSRLSRSEDTTTYRHLQALASSNLDIAEAIGRAFTDKENVQQGSTYFYELRAQTTQGDQKTLATDVKVTVGQTLSAPTGLDKQAGDSRVLLWWQETTGAKGYHVYRSEDRSGNYRRVNETLVTSQATKNLTGETFQLPRPAFLDYQRFTAAGDTTTHTVKGHSIGGPLDGTTYYYKVAAVDLDGTTSNKIGPVAATPVDSAAPVTPKGVKVSPNENPEKSKIEVQWQTVEQDVNGQVEIQGVKKYSVYRYSSPKAIQRSDSDLVATVSHPVNRNLVDIIDSDPNRPQYGEKTYYYRIQAEDEAGNQSALSAAEGGTLEDVKPPSPPNGVETQGKESSIEIRWDENSEPDLDGYVIYRSRCHYGEWTPCPKDEDEDLVEEPEGEESEGSGVSGSERSGSDEPCSGPFREAGRITRKEAKARREEAETDKTWFRDDTMPEDSPICYAYLVKAKDRSQNASGSWPPNPDEEIQCAQLQEETPPEPAVVANLNAREGGIRVEWIGPPVQDVAAYHVYRSGQKNGSYTLVGGRTVSTQQNTSSERLESAFQVPDRPVCADVPVNTQPEASSGHFIDKSAQPNTEYWYKVVGVDHHGNEVDVGDATPAGTFTFSEDQLGAPLIQSTEGRTDPCAVQVEWVAQNDSNARSGFAVFRSKSQEGTYRQISPVVTGSSSYVDDSIACGTAYWYKVVTLGKNGHFSPFSEAEQASANP